ncbi:MAG: HlyD family secretion protein [Halieaceae bacterium]|jgi:HlyD family secretion protein
MKSQATAVIRYMGSKTSPKNRYLLSVLGGGLALITLIMATAPEHDPNQVEEKIWPVSTLSAEPASLSPELQLFGRLETPLHTQLTAALSAEVKSVLVREGDLVTQGQLLVALDAADAGLRVAQREADMRDAQASLDSTRAQSSSHKLVLKRRQELHQLSQARVDRLAHLTSKHLIATETLEQARQEVARQAIALAEQQLQVDNHPYVIASAEARLKQIQAQLAQDELNLLRTGVLAPFDGRISSIDAAPGDRVQIGLPLVAMYATEGLQIRAAVTSTTAAALRVALDSNQRIEAHLEGGISLSLNQLASEVSSGRSGVDALFTLDRVNTHLALGRAVELTVILPMLEDVVAVPIQSVHGNDKVYVVEDTRLRAVQVENVGQRENANGDYELFIRSPDIELGTAIVTTNLAKATTGLKVEIVNQPSVDPVPADSEEKMVALVNH